MKYTDPVFLLDYRNLGKREKSLVPILSGVWTLLYLALLATLGGADPGLGSDGEAVNFVLQWRISSLASISEDSIPYLVVGFLLTPLATLSFSFTILFLHRRTLLENQMDLNRFIRPTLWLTFGAVLVLAVNFGIPLTDQAGRMHRAGPFFVWPLFGVFTSIAWILAGFALAQWFGLAICNWRK